MKRKINFKDLAKVKKERDEELLCRNCGNFKTFTRELYETIQATITEEYDAIEDGIEEVAKTEDDSDINNNTEWECKECNKGDTVNFIDDFEEGDDDFFTYIYKHIDKKGFWSKREIKREVNRNKKMCKLLMVNNL